MPADPDIQPMSLDEAIKSILMAEADKCLSSVDVKQIILFGRAACHPDPLTPKQIQVATEWALQARAQVRLIEHVFSKRMTLFPQEDGSVKFGGKLMRVDEYKVKVDAQRQAKATGATLLEGKS